ncbi:MAG: ribosome-associated translation inhibitor RaiA [Muribaculaceae bacterium]|nr:ribosome-associated translation inhibitor RaiA [Muribaculaceae bacterium]
MNVNIQAIHFEIADRLVEFVNKKCDRLARRYPLISDIDVNLRVVKPETAMNKEAVVKALAPQEEVVATKVADSFEEAVDLALEAIERQLEKNKDKK